MLTGDQLREARELAGLTQEQLALQIGVTMRSVGNWERTTGVPRSRERRVRDLLGEYLGAGSYVPARGVDLRDISDARLLAEIARRFDRVREDGGSGGDTAATSVTKGPWPEKDQAPAVPDDVAASDHHRGKGRAQAERERQDEESER